MSLNFYRFTMWICIHKGENGNLKRIPQLSDQKSCVKIWYTSSLRKYKQTVFILIKTTLEYIHVDICHLKASKQTNEMVAEIFLQQLFCSCFGSVRREEGQAGEQQGRCSNVLTLQALQKYHTVLKELICKVRELTYRCTPISA